MLKFLKLENFRSHLNFTLELDQITALVGENGAGKSNILESISLLSFCRSYREDDKKSLVSFGAEYSRVVGDNLEFFIQQSPRYFFKIKENGVFKKQTDFVGTLPAVVFSPETMAIITGGPKERRKFLDLLISQSDKKYLTALIAYEKVRQQRNKLLQMIAENRARVEDLNFWNTELVREGEIIIESRQRTIDVLNSKLSRLYSQLANENYDLRIDYIGTTESFTQDLEANLYRDLASKRTSIGPHRDDFVVKLNSTNAANFASRGEIRSAVLALKIAEINLLEENIQKAPILLLDDIFSEFDRNRREHLANLINSYQTIITTTEIESFGQELLSRAKVVKLEKNK